MRTTQEAIRPPLSAQREKDEKQARIEEIHEIDHNEFDYIVAPYKDPDVTGRNSQTVGALGANTPGNGYTTMVNNDYYGDGTHAMIARPKSAAKTEEDQRRALFPKYPKGSLKTVVNDENFIYREAVAEQVRPGGAGIDFAADERAAARRKAQIESNPEQAEVLDKMKAGLPVDAGAEEE
jgi:hypothetical protein